MWSLRTDDSAELLHVDIEENTHFSPIAKGAQCMPSAKGQWGIFLALLFSPLVYVCLVFSAQPWSEVGEVVGTLRLRPKGGHGGLVAKPCPTLCNPKASQVPLSMGFPRQEYHCGLPFPSPGALPNPGIEPMSPALQAEPPRKP